MKPAMIQSDVLKISKQKRDGQIVLAWVFGFFATFIAVDVYMVSLAVTTQTGMVTDRPYERGLAYNQEIDAVARQQELGWRSDLRLDGTDVIFTLHDVAGHAIDGAVGTVTFFRKSHAGADFTLDLRSEGNGQYRADFSTYAISGRWQIRVMVQKGDTSFRKNLDVVL